MASLEHKNLLIIRGECTIRVHTQQTSGQVAGCCIFLTEAAEVPLYFKGYLKASILLYLRQYKKFLGGLIVAAGYKYIMKEVMYYGDL